MSAVWGEASLWRFTCCCASVLDGQFATVTQNCGCSCWMRTRWVIIGCTHLLGCEHRFHAGQEMFLVRVISVCHVCEVAYAEDTHSSTAFEKSIGQRLTFIYFAVEWHPFWRQACAMIDPQDFLITHSIIQPTTKGGSAATRPIRLSPYQHYRNIFGCSCIVCRINYPYTSHGLVGAKRAIPNPWLGQVMTCKDHRKSTFCGVCLREAPTMEGEAEYAHGLTVCAVENEDDQTWPGVETTCKGCRKQWIWLVAKHDPVEREAIGGTAQLVTDDWETRQAIDAFVDHGEGMIKDVLELAKEKYWYKVNTKLPDMLSQALAASRFAGRAEGAEGYVSEEEISDDEEEDAELVSITEDAAGIRDLAVNDFVRNRILDGHWVCPTDEWNMRWVSTPANTPNAVHPCPWDSSSVFDGALLEGEGEGEGSEALAHPRPKTVAALRPPTYNISQRVYESYTKQFRAIIYPAMQNVVQRVVVECEADGKDPVPAVREMTVDDVARALQDEAVWRTGVDWLAWRAARERRSKDKAREKEKEKDDDASSTSSRSSGSHMTSPGLSTTTLQTTPSPPPSSVKDDEGLSSPVSALPPALETSPTGKEPQLMHPIPYVPSKLSHMPEYTLSMVASVSIFSLLVEGNYETDGVGWGCRRGRVRAHLCISASVMCAADVSRRRP